MKLCTGCKEEKQFSEFSKNKNTKDGFTHYCKVCVSKQNKEWSCKNKERSVKNTERYRHTRVEKVKQIKQKLCCVVCGEKEMVCLDFHHRDPSQKDMSVSLLTRRGHAWQRVLDEINKCICVCSNCHRKIHAGLIEVGEVS